MVLCEVKYKKLDELATSNVTRYFWPDIYLMSQQWLTSPLLMSGLAVILQHQLLYSYYSSHHKYDHSSAIALAAHFGIF